MLIDVTNEAIFVNRDDPGPAVATSPTTSLWQMDMIGIRVIEFVAWSPPRPHCLHGERDMVNRQFEQFVRHVAKRFAEERAESRKEIAKLRAEIEELKQQTPPRLVGGRDTERKHHG